MLRILETALDVGRDDIAGDADNEEVAEALVEDQLRGDARVATAQDRREGLLPGRQRLAPLLARMAVDGFSRDEAFVPLEQPLPRCRGVPGDRLVGPPSPKRRRNSQPCAKSSGRG